MPSTVPSPSPFLMVHSPRPYPPNSSGLHESIFNISLSIGSCPLKPLFSFQRKSWFIPLPPLSTYLCSLSYSHFSKREPILDVQSPLPLLSVQACPLHFFSVSSMLTILMTPHPIAVLPALQTRVGAQAIPERHTHLAHLNPINIDWGRSSLISFLNVIPKCDSPPKQQQSNKLRNGK